MARPGRHLAGLVPLVFVSTLFAGPALAAPTWLQPATAVSPAGQDAIYQQVAVDLAGNVTAVWSSHDGAFNLIQVSTRPVGGTWTVPATLSETGEDAYDPQVAVSPAGSTTVIWRRGDGSHDRIQASSRSVGAGWSEPVTISGAGQNAIDSQVTMDESGTATAVWTRSDGSHDRIQATRRSVGGGWTAALDISQPGLNARSPQVAVDSSGTTVAVWERDDGANYRVQASTRPVDGSWTTPATLSDAGRDAYRPQVALDPAGNATAIWYGPMGINHRVQASTRPAAGAWTAPAAISEAGQSAYLPQLAIDSSGVATAAWHRNDGTYNRVQAATRPAGGAWTPASTLSVAGQNADAAEVAANAAGNTTLAWRLDYGGDRRVQASTRTSGGTWTTATTLSDAGASAYDPRVAVDSGGNSTVIWERSDGSHGRVEAVGLDAAGPVVGAFAIPASGTAGTPVSMSTTVTDVWSAVSNVSWDFGDATTATGTSVSHTWTTPGAYTVSLTATDAVGNSTTRRATINVAPAAIVPPQVTAPQITGLRLKPGHIEIKGPKRRTRTKVVLRLTEDAKVTITLKRKGAKGKKAKQKVVLRRSLDSGRTTLRLSSKQLKHKLGKRHFKPGRYKLTVKATNSAGKDKRSITLRVRR